MKVFKYFVLIYSFTNLYLFAEEFSYSFPFNRQNQKEIPTISLKQMEQLREPKKPKYVHFLDWQDYPESKNILKKGILFTYRNLMAKNVYIAGNFTNGKKIKMKRNSYGIFYYLQPIVQNVGETNFEYFYKFYVDGVWQKDPTNNEIRIQDNTEFSYYYFDDPEKHYLDRTEVLEIKNAYQTKFYLVEFKVHEKHLKRILNKSNIESVSVVGDFNRWNADINILKKDSKGVFRFKTYLTPGIHFYNFVVDGEWVLDPLNENTKYLSDFRKLFNYLELNQ